MSVERQNVIINKKKMEFFLGLSWMVCITFIFLKYILCWESFWLVVKWLNSVVFVVKFSWALSLVENKMDWRSAWWASWVQQYMLCSPVSGRQGALHFGSSLCHEVLINKFHVFLPDLFVTVYSVLNMAACV